MPIYEYECAKCGHTLEAIQKVSEAALTRCPACRKNSLRKRVSAPAFHLKGGGWYVTDFRDKPKTEAKEKTSKEDVASTTKAGKEEKKPISTEMAKPSKKSEPTATE